MSHRSDPDQPVSYYPAMLDLAARPVVVIGGGDVAEQKVSGLLAAGADVAVVSPDLTPDLTAWMRASRLAWKPRKYRDGDLKEAFLAFAATGIAAVDKTVWQEAERRRIPVNAADDPPHCSFILPAVHRDGDLVVAVSTGGRAPALAVRLRDRFARALGKGYAQYLELLGGFRERIAGEFPTFAQRREVWYRIVDSDALDHLRADDTDTARELIGELIDQYVRTGRRQGVA